MEKRAPLIPKDLRQPYISLDSIKFSNQVIEVHVTDSLPYFNPVMNGQAFAVICEQITVRSYDFDFFDFYVHMPMREEGGVGGRFSAEEFNKLQSIYIDESLGDFYTELLQLNWDTHEKYVDIYSTFLDRVNMVFQNKIREEYPREFPGGFDWYGYNCFIIFNEYLLGSGRRNAEPVVFSLWEDDNQTFDVIDLERLFEILAKYKR